MVVRLNRPVADQNAFIDAVVEQRQGGRNAQFFTQIKADWKVRVQAYLAAGGDPAVIQPWPAVQAEAQKFLNLYLHPAENSVQKSALATLRERTMQFCPACGEDGTPNTLDHYLPKQAYPEYAITAFNLFPMCDTCQGEKLSTTVNVANERLFLHPYFDHFLEMQVVQLEIGPPYEAPATMTLRPCPGLDPLQGALVERHLEHLAISTRRYYHFFKAEYVHLLRLVVSIREKGLDLTMYLELFCDKAKDKSVNSWGHVFYAGVLADPALMDYLRHGQLPNHL